MIKIIHCGYVGTEMPYIYQKSRYTSPPLGYTPFFINHVGRHGARYLTNVDQMAALIRQLSEAEALGELKEEGKALKKKLHKLLPLESEDAGLLTPSGFEMEKSHYSINLCDKGEGEYGSTYLVHMLTPVTKARLEKGFGRDGKRLLRKLITTVDEGLLKQVGLCYNKGR